ncbi:TonB-dependent receptor domain-containing protein [Sphingomonas sp. C3-2]|uniref:TonB-dependent receptor domain-containing protein n=1 Tax=Sphingomonas sp. C3-2 TaxID=3062169 RepID=UPI00294AC72B|nr:TonB-dependent receptor [Sphingomonas sp. C3-2]WOK35983.1 TonB-dependent receptor [Sphingomonas sp. C3-2]
MSPVSSRLSVLMLGLMLGAAPSALMAQQRPDTEPSEATGGMADVIDDEIVVTAESQRGAVIGNIAPEQQLNAGDIRAYGVSSISELVDALAPQTNAASGPPVMLLNGKRISGFAEIRDIPTEAIERVDILPEDVSLSYGYSPNQKVVNIVLRERFRALTGAVYGSTTTDGGRESGQVSANFLRIRGDNRMSLDVKYVRADDLLESERDIVSTPPSRPYALGGNITAVPGAASDEIDPALSALAGGTVTVAAVPGSAAGGRPSLNDFVVGANAAATSDLGKYRTLSPATENLTVNAGIARMLPGDISSSLNILIETNDSDSLQGLPSASLTLPGGSPFSPFAGPVQLHRYFDQAGALGQSVNSRNVEVGLTLSGAIKPWNWTFTGKYDNALTRTATDRGFDIGALQAALLGGDATVNPYGALAPGLLSSRLTDRARAQSSGFAGDLLVSGPLFALPAGRATTSLTANIETRDFESRSWRGGVPSETGFSRDIAGIQGNIDLPIASRRAGVLSAIGDLSLNANGAVQYLSDFGTLTTYGYGLRWTPIEAVRFIGSVSESRSAPTGAQINNPTVLTPNVPVFDYRTGETVYVSQVTGGNLTLDESKKQLIRLGLMVKPFSKPDLRFSANYTRTNTDNPVMSFPDPTPQIEAAFGDRFLRDADGRLIQIDARPINFAEARTEQLRWGVDFSMPLKSRMQKQFEAWRAAGSKPEDRPEGMRGSGERPPRGEGGGEGRPPSGEMRGGDGPRGFGGPGGGGRGPRGFGRGGGGGRLQFALYHNWTLEDSILIAPGLPKLDLLDGDAIGSSGGSSRHKIEAQAGYMNNGIGVRMEGNWQSATHVDGALGSANSRLRFSDLATIDLRIFANLGQMPKLAREHPFLRGARVMLSVENLFNARQNVTDETGATPLRYQADYLDPQGRRITLSFRKLLF